MKDPAIRPVLLNTASPEDVHPNMVQGEAEHLCGDAWLVLAQPGPTFRLRGRVVRVRKGRNGFIAVEDLGKPH